MGQAKIRGTYEQRCAEGAVKRAKQEAEWQAQQAAQEQALTAEEREQLRRFDELIAIGAGLSANLLKLEGIV